GLELVEPNSDAGSHFVTAELQEVFATFFQGLDHRQTRNAPTAPLAFTRIVESDHDGRTMELFGQTRSHDADYSRMPSAGTDDDRGVPVGHEGARELLQDLLEGLLFDRLPITILPVQAARQKKRLVRVIRKQQLE